MVKTSYIRAYARSAVVCGSLFTVACDGFGRGDWGGPHGDGDDESPGIFAAPGDTASIAVVRTAATFKTLEDGKYLCAENGGNADLTADRDSAAGWETFKIVDLNGGKLESGDAVALETERGSLVSAQNGGGGDVTATATSIQAWETLRIQKADAGTGPIESGSVVGFQTIAGNYLRAVDGGGGEVNAEATQLGSWASFTVSLTAAPTAPTAQNPVDSSVPETLPGGWKLAWNDEFRGPTIDTTKWAFEQWQPGVVNNERQAYTTRAENARIENDVLVIEARHDGENGSFTSARLKTEGKASFLYGRVEARLQVPAGLGTWPAFWMMPDDMSRGWPGCGEIDIMEHVGYDEGIVHSTMHTAGFNSLKANQRSSKIQVPDATTGFHVYAVEWFPDHLDAFIDDVKYFTLKNDGTGDDSWPFDKKFYMILNLAVGGDWGGVKGIAQDGWPRQYKVDYVRVYQK
jgi:beta-glucanase (GH16 family)